MLAIIKNFSNGLISKIIIGLICASFIFFGISKEFFFNSDSTILKIGETKVSTEEYNEKLKKIFSSFKKNNLNFKLDKIYKNILANELLNNITLKILLNNYTKEKGIPVSEEKIYEIIKATKEFQDNKGNFVPEKFDYLLKINNINEQDFITDISHETSRNILTNTITSYTDNNLITKVNYIKNNEKRIVDLVKINISKEKPNLTNLKDINKELNELYKTNKFFDPEYREISYLLITPETAKKYKNLKNINNPKIYKYMTEIAENIIDEINGENNFKFIEQKFNITKIKLPAVDVNGKTKNKKLLQNKILNKKNRDIAFFALEEKGISDIIDEGNNIILLFIDKIHPTKQKSFEEVKDILLKIKEKNEKEAEASNKANNILNNIKQGKSLIESIKIVDKNLLIQKNLKLDKNNYSFGNQFLEKLFNAKIKDSIFIKNNNEYIIAILKQIDHTNNIKDKDYNDFKLSEKTKYKNMILADYVYYLKHKYNVKQYNKTIDLFLKNN